MLSHMSDTKFLVDLQRQDYDYSLDMWTLGCIFDGMVSAMLHFAQPFHNTFHICQYFLLVTHKF